MRWATEDAAFRCFVHIACDRCCSSCLRSMLRTFTVDDGSCCRMLSCFEARQTASARRTKFTSGTVERENSSAGQASEGLPCTRRPRSCELPCSWPAAARAALVRTRMLSFRFGGCARCRFIRSRLSVEETKRRERYTFSLKKIRLTNKRHPCSAPLGLCSVYS